MDKKITTALILAICIIIASVILILPINDESENCVKIVNDGVYYAENEGKTDTVITFGSEIKINGTVIKFDESIPTDIVPIAISDTYYIDCVKSINTFNINYWIENTYKCISFLKSGTLVIDNFTKVATGKDLTFTDGHMPEQVIKTFSTDSYKRFATHLSVKQTDKCYVTYGNVGSFYLNADEGYYGLQNPGIGYSAVFCGNTLITGNESEIQFNLDKKTGTKNVDILTMPYENKIFVMVGDIRVDAYYAIISTTIMGTIDNSTNSQ